MKLLISFLLFVLSPLVYAGTMVSIQQNTLFAILDLKTDSKALYESLTITPKLSNEQSIKIFKTKDEVFNLTCTEFKASGKLSYACVVFVYLKRVPNQETQVGVNGSLFKVLLNEADSGNFDIVFSLPVVMTDIGPTKSFAVSDGKVTIACTESVGRSTLCGATVSSH